MTKYGEIVGRKIVHTDPEYMCDACEATSKKPMHNLKVQQVDLDFCDRCWDEVYHRVTSYPND